MNKKILLGVGFAASVFGAPGAFAALDDTPYFNLWTKGVVNDNLVGAGTSIALCGTSACATTSTPGTPNQYAQFSVVHTQPAGSGYIDPFLRFQHNEGANNGSDISEAAYNTNYRDGSQGTGLISGYDDPTITTTNQAKDTKAGGDKRNFFNHAIRLGDLQVDENGMVTFLLDINETGNPGVTLRLDELAWYVAESDQMNHYFADDSTGSNDPNGYLTDGTEIAREVWNMDWNAFSPGGVTPTAMGDSNYPSNPEKRTGYGGLNLANINDQGKAGSGDFDLQVKLDKQLFLAAAGGLGDDAYVYLYNFAGRAGDLKQNEQDGTEADAGFEEWASVLSTTPPPDNGVPEPSTALLLFGGLAGMLKIQRQRKASQTNA